jgi:large subunit ribosomal protein L17
MLRNLASSLFLTEGDFDEQHDENVPKVRGRVVTTLAKAKEVRPLVEKCVTIARHSLRHEAEAEQYATGADRNSPEWIQWRGSDQWRKWNEAIAPAVAARRRALRLLGSREAVRILFDDIGRRFENRPGGYTRIIRLATPRLGDAGTQAILEFVGVRDREPRRAETPRFEDEQKAPEEVVQPEGAAAEAPAEQQAGEAAEGSTAGDEKTG